jgi:hypothetical protein
VTLLVNWAHFMDWAHSNGRDLVLAAEGIAGREHRYYLPPTHTLRRPDAPAAARHESMHLNMDPPDPSACTHARMKQCGRLCQDA